MKIVKRLLAIMLCELLVVLPATSGPPKPETRRDTARQTLTLRDYLQKSYVELFHLAPELQFSTAQIEAEQRTLNQGKSMCVSRFKERAKDYQRQLEAAETRLKETTNRLSDAQRKALHCKIQNLRLLHSEAQSLESHAIPTAYDNLQAKLDLIEKWPAVYRQTREEISSGAYLKRRWGDVKDIGFRRIAANQQDDIKQGQEAVEEMKRTGLLPPALKNQEIQDYVNDLAQKIARKSDLQVPLHVSVLDSREINAFALPGGYLFVERGLLEAVDDESELTGVIAHEMAHDAARHSHKMMRRATIANVFFQAAQVASVVLTGGIMGICLYYALQYGYYGLGLILNLKLLGVSRENELEADQLGIQYTWNAGYDPSGFVRFFDKMATRTGYVHSVSWFRTHPPFYQRMVDAEREIMFLPRDPLEIVQTSTFERMKKELAPITAKAEREGKERAGLPIPHEEGCQAPKKLGYQPGEPIEEVCEAPLQNPRRYGSEVTSKMSRMSWQ